MVNNMGHWTYDPNEPEETRCNLDDIADIITKEHNYTPVNISIEELSERILAEMEEDVKSTSSDGSADGILYDKHHNIYDVFAAGWIYDHTPISDFDYKA